MSSSTAKVLADTNVWIAYFRGERAKAQEQPAAEALDRLIGEDCVVLSGVVEKNVDFIDACIAAQLFEAGPETIYTFNRKHFGRFTHLEVRAP